MKEKKKNDLVKTLKKVWEDEVAEVVAEKYNRIVGELQDLDIYTCNMIVNLLFWQTGHKTYLSTVAKPKTENNKGGKE